jgi:undecaprenyl-diphosphatase
MQRLFGSVEWLIQGGTGCVEAVLTWIGGLPPPAVYLVAAVLVFAETALIVGLVLPGEVTLLFVGYLAYAGTLRLPVAMVVMMAAALAGDAAAFAEGRRGGPKLRGSRLGGWIGPRRWAKAEALLARHGGRAVGVGRFIAFARTLTPRLAGMSGLRYRRMLPWDVLGVFCWVGGSILAGYLAGSSYARAAAVFGRATQAVLLLGLLIIALVWLGRYLGRHRDPVSAFGRRLTNLWPLRRLHAWYVDAFGWLTARVGSGGAVAINLIVGLAGLLGIGVVLTWLIDRLVHSSGIPLVDPLISGWFAARRTPAVEHAATATLSVLRGPFLVLAVAVVGLLLNPPRRAWRRDLLGVFGSAGAFLPLLALALAADWAQPDGTHHGGFPNRVTVVTAGLGMLAWLLSRRVPWAASVLVWLVAVGGVLLDVGASLYVGAAWPSELVASVLLGSLWDLVIVIAWHTRPVAGRTRTTRPAGRRDESGGSLDGSRVEPY